jgi:hypothetical protein
MKRAKILLLALSSVLLALNPADCFKPWSVDKDTLDCCKRGNCAPGTKSNDSCCQAVAPESAQCLQAARQVSLPSPDSLPASFVAEFRTSYFMSAARPVGQIQHPPPLEPVSAHLPLLI